MLHRNGARPWRHWGRAAGGPVAVANRPQPQAIPSAISRQPVALAVFKRSRWCIVAKVTFFDGDREPILAVAWRGQQGTREAISLPEAAIEYARQAGVTRFYLRDDRRMAMLTCDLVTFERGKLQADGERYLPLTWLKPVPWRPWTFAETTVQLQGHPRPEPAGRQLTLFTEVARCG